MNKYHIPNLGKACDVLELISRTNGGCLLKDISMNLDIPRTTTLRITQTLLESDYLTKTEEGRFTLGTALVQLGVKALDSLDVRSFARPILRALSEETGESSHLAMLNGNQSLLIEVADSPHPVRIAARAGTLVDLYSSSTGKIFLAYCFEDPEVFCKKLKLTEHTPNTQATIRQIMAGIQETRKRGYALDNEEHVLGVRCIAAPITNAFGKTVNAIGITASTATFTKARVRKMAEQVKQAAGKISTKLGYADE